MVWTPTVITSYSIHYTKLYESGEGYGFHWWIIRLPRHDNAFDLSDQILESPAAVGRGGQWIVRNNFV